MTVYELIQELAKYEGDTEVEFHVKAEFSTDVEAKFDREDENDKQEVAVDAEFDEDVDFYDIDGYRDSRYNPRVVINFEYYGG